MYLVLALLLQSTPVLQELPPKAEIIEAYDKTLTLIDGVLGQLPKRFSTSPNQPYLGFTMRTEELGDGPDGLPRRHTFVVSVFRGTPAFEAGVRLGDRIAAIGAIECDTLKPRGVFFYMGEYSDAIPLTLERNGQRFGVSVQRAPLPCASLVWNQFPVAEWRARFVRTQSRVKAVRDAIADQELTEQQTLLVMAACMETAGLIETQLYEIRNQLDPTLSPLCEQEK